MYLTKWELREKLRKMEMLACHKNESKTRIFRTLHKSFLKDYDKFKEMFEKIPEDEVFHVVRTNSTTCKELEKVEKLFDTFTLKLWQFEGKLYIYIIAEYKIK